jgi:HEAT repeat protein
LQWFFETGSDPRWKAGAFPRTMERMRHRAPRLVLFLALAGAAAVLAAGGGKLKDRLVEGWQISRLEAGDPTARAQAIEWLRQRGTARAAPALIDELERLLAAAIETAAPSDKDQLRADLFKPSPRFPPAAALLAIMDRAPGDCARALARDASDRLTPYLALGHLGARGAAAVPELVRKLEGAGQHAWDWVPDVLGAIGPAARPALPLIVDRLRKAEPGSVLLARQAGSIALAPDVPALLALLQSPEPPVRRAALWALERMGGRAATAVPTLEACLHDPDDEVQNLAWMALSSIRDELAP